MVREKNWRVSLCVQELYHPRDFPWILAATPGCRNLTGVSVLNRGLRFYLVLEFGLLGQQVYSYWIGIYPTQVSPCSSLTVAWTSHGWWGRWAWGRRKMINLLPWRCHGCWRGKTGVRTRWQTRNHDRNEVLRVALYPNTVFNEMCFMTIDPFIWVSVFIAKLS